MYTYLVKTETAMNGNIRAIRYIVDQLPYIEKVAEADCDSIAVHNVLSDLPKDALVYAYVDDDFTMAVKDSVPIGTFYWGVIPKDLTIAEVCESVRTARELEGLVCAL